MGTLLSNWLGTNLWLAMGTGLQIALAVFALIAMPFDQRKILGLNPWIKPLKFDLSVLILLVTMAAFLSGLHRFPTVQRWIGGGLAVSLTLENFLISLQALRGVRSHMNVSTPFDTTVGNLMGLMIIAATAAIAVTLGIAFVEQPSWPKAVTWGVRLGLLVLLAGSCEGAVMVVHGGHTVGAPDGLSGLPITNWSKKNGDLRVAHFFALHAVQAFPMFAYLCSRTSIAEQLQVAAVFGSATLYAVAVWLLFRQAMQGLPVLG